jgi:hypothetical protein
MNEIAEVLSIVGLFFLRIGVPLVILLVIGTLIDRAYRRREARDTERPVSIDLPMSVDQPEKVEEFVEAEAGRSTKRQKSS